MYRLQWAHTPKFRLYRNSLRNNKQKDTGESDFQSYPLNYFQCPVFNKIMRLTNEKVCVYTGKKGIKTKCPWGNADWTIDKHFKSAITHMFKELKDGMSTTKGKCENSTSPNIEYQ